MAIVTKSKPNGWMPWISVDTYVNGKITPYGAFPQSYLPTVNFWGKTSSSHCDLPVFWSLLDPYTAFLAAGGASGSIIGAVVGLDAASEALKQPPSVTWALGEPGFMLPPTTGYCTGDAYKENTYFYLTVIRPMTGVLSATMYSDVFQRAKLKRIYVQHGEIDGVKSEKVGDKTIYTVTIGLHEKMDSKVAKSFPGIGSVMTIYSKDKVVTSSVKKISAMWEIELDGDAIPSIGDFFTFDNIWCIEDPLLISGLWNGNEDDNQTIRAKSGYNLHLTDYSYPYDEFSFTGAYVFKKDSKIISVSSSSPLETVVDGEWVWINFGKTSELYGSAVDRWKRNVLFDSKNPKSLSSIKFTAGTNADVTSWMELADSSFIRMEISKGGSTKRHNWHAPILAKCWLKQNGKYFKIISQPNGNVIDVLKKDITGTTTLDIYRTASIVNQYAWIINEHYMGASETGIFNSKITTKSYNSVLGTTSIVMLPAPATGGTVKYNYSTYNADYLNKNGCFFNRFVLDPTSTKFMPSNLKKCYIKNQKWKMIGGSGSTYDIMEIRGLESSKIILLANGDASTETIAHITFDSPYKKYFNTVNILVYEFSEGIDGGSPTLCMDAEYISAPIIQNLKEGTIVGACGGRYWGLPEEGVSSIRDEKINLFFTVKGQGALCVAAHYNKLIQEDGVGYRDPYSNKMTLRKGFLNFTEIPRKMEVSIGNSTTESVSGESLSISAEKGRLKSIQFELPEGELKDDPIMFAVKNKKDYWGNLIRGSGATKLRGLEFSGTHSDAKPEDYTFRDFITSPVYVYKRTTGKCLYKSNTIDIGIGREDSPINIVGGTVKSIIAEYVSENQTLEDYSVFDWFKIKDGEDIIVYGQNVDSFTLDGKKINSVDNATSWDVNFGVFIIGSSMEAIGWSCPIEKEFKNDFQYPLMVLPGCELMGSVFDSMQNKIHMFVKGVSGDSQATQNSFIGMYSVETINLLNNVKKCKKEDKTQLDFLYRQLNFPNDFLTDASMSFANNSCIKTVLPAETEDSKNKRTNYDFFTRVLGNEATQSQIRVGEIDSIKVVSPYILPNGVLCLLYDGNFGVRMAFSTDKMHWTRSPFIIAKEAHSPVFIDEDVIAYITNSGNIEAKVNISSLLNRIIYLNNYKGNTDESLEIKQIQSEIDNTKIVLISGQKGYQRMSGYKTLEGIYKIFFYYTDSQNTNAKGVVGCIESTDKLNWQPASNF